MVSDPTRRSAFIEENLGLVHSCAGRFRNRGLEYDDLYSAGCMGLIKAYDGFDETRGVCFSTYAVPVILGEIKKLFREGGTVKVSRSLKELGLRINAAREHHHKLCGTEPTLSQLAEELGVGEITLRDIVKELEKPARDPRDEMPKPVLRTDVLDMKDLKEGMVLKGTVRNVIDFGAFVDIGVHQDGLVHISEMTERYIKHPLEAVSVGDVVDVRVIGVDMKKKRISLSMKGIK